MNLNSFEIFLKLQTESIENCRVKEAMEYSLFSSGKRIRPQLIASVAEHFSVDEKSIYQAACAIEMIHCYSLIHDDLPAMDNAEYRRGKLTNHLAFDEATAILAGDALLTYAFEIISQIDNINTLEIIKVMANYCGPNGMILGQDYDINDYGDDLESVEKVYTLKTGCLFSACLKIGALLANRKDLLSDFGDIGLRLGYIFQIQDDILDYQSTSVTGKSSTDILNNKKTIIYHLGIKNTELLLKKEYNILREKINSLSNNFIELNNLIDTLLKRSY